MRALLRADLHRRQSGGGAGSRSGTGRTFHVHQLTAQPHDLRLLQLDNLGLLLELQLQQGVAVGRRGRGQPVDGCPGVVVAVNAERRLEVVHPSTRLTQLTTKIVDLFDQRHVLLRTVQCRSNSVKSACRAGRRESK